MQNVYIDISLYWVSYVAYCLFLLYAAHIMGNLCSIMEQMPALVIIVDTLVFIRVSLYLEHS
jgi:hypothetical protein